MQTVKLVIPGKFYDSQIYNRKLYLWKLDGSIDTVDWDRLVGRISASISEELDVALNFLLQNSDSLYGNSLLQDNEVRSLVQAKFKKLSESTIEVKAEDLYSCTNEQQDSPFPFPHADSVIHYHRMYVGSQSGVSVSSCVKKNIFCDGLEPAEKLFDLPVLSISASHQTLAVAAGDEGLFDYPVILNSTPRYEPRILSHSHCNLTRWLYPSIFGSSYFNDGYLADFKRKKKVGNELSALGRFSNDSSVRSIERDTNRKKEDQYEREFRGLISHEKIFQQSDTHVDSIQLDERDIRFTWGAQDKLCSMSGNSVKVSQYNPRANAKDKFKDLGSEQITGINSEVLRADSSLFGIILEQEDGLLVVSSSLESQFFDGEPVNWRVFPNTKNYSNHLHVIYDDELHIYAFSDDYFVDQHTKKLGIKATSRENLYTPRSKAEPISLEPVDDNFIDDLPF